MNWWLERSVGGHQKKYEENEEPGNYLNVGLIIDVTGIVGCSLVEILPLPDTPGGPWKVYGVARRKRPVWFAGHHLEYIQCDVSNTEETVSKLSHLSDITHIFYVSWFGSEDCQINATMFENVLNAVIPNAPNLKHICLQTGIKHYFGIFSAETDVKPHDSPFTEDLPRLNVRNFYHNLEDILYEKAARNGLTWSIHRPGPIFGFSPCSRMNLVASLCAYALICKHENKPLVYPGSKASWDCFSDAVDADLVAEHEIWAAVDPKAKNQVLNCCNGDVFKWKHLWEVLPEEFGLEMVGYIEGNKQASLEGLMKDKDKVWDEIVEQNNLVATKLKDIAAFWIADNAFSTQNLLSSMNKNRGLGFVGFRDSTKSFVSCIHKMRAYKFIPNNVMV